MKFNKPIPKEELKKYQNLPLEDKIKLSQEIIKEFYENVDSNKVYIASSFGKDSIVLVDLVRNLYPNIPIIYINTGVEHPSILNLSKNYDNVIELKPKKTMMDVIEEYGYITPLGKDKSRTLDQVRKNLYDGKFNTVKVKKLRGDFGKKSRYNYTKIIPHLLAPFKISDRCCYWLKEQPMNSYTKKNGYKYQFNGMTAEESLMRKNSMIQNGFNFDFDSRPLAHWKVHDILEYILKYNLKLAECYGNIVKDTNGKYITTKFYRTGCTCCPVGSHLDNPNQFQLLYKYDKETWDYVINQLGFKQVLDYFKVPYTDETCEPHNENLKEESLENWIV